MFAQFSLMLIRSVRSSDISRLVELMIAFAHYDGSSHEVKVDTVKLKEVLFADHPQLYSIVAEHEGKAVAFLNYYYSYSSFELKKCLWVEDVFVLDQHRRKGIGEALFRYVKQIANDESCANVEWLVRRDNQLGIKFYNKLKAKVDDGTIYVKWKI